MTEVRFDGEVDAYDWSRDMSAFPSIGGRNVIDEVEAAFPQGRDVKVTLAIEPVPQAWVGALISEMGWTGTEVTPGDPPVIRVGDVDVLKQLREFDGRTVILIVEDP